MRIIYSAFVLLYGWGIKLASSFQPKAKLWVDGRTNLFDNIQLKLADNKAPVIWMHCASLGEFEQGRPLLEALRINSPESKLLLTFFSPSGYEVRKDYAGVDWVFYLPLDTISNASKFIDIIKPTKVLFVKYEFWFNFLKVLNENKIPIYFISVNIRPAHYFFKWYGSWALNQLKKVTHFFVQNQQSHQLLNTAGIYQCSVTGDTRFDRVLSIAKEATSFPLIEKFSAGKKTIIAGSTWREDERLLAQIILRNASKSDGQNATTSIEKLIIAPHEIHENSLRAVEEIFIKSKT
mgnify:CR=1 FL=1